MWGPSVSVNRAGPPPGGISDFLGEMKPASRAAPALPSFLDDYGRTGAGASTAGFVVGSLPPWSRHSFKVLRDIEARLSADCSQNGGPAGEISLLAGEDCGAFGQFIALPRQFCPVFRGGFVPRACLFSRQAAL